MYPICIVNLSTFKSKHLIDDDCVCECKDLTEKPAKPMSTLGSTGYSSVQLQQSADLAHSTYSSVPLRQSADLADSTYHDPYSQRGDYHPHVYQNTPYGPTFYHIAAPSSSVVTTPPYPKTTVEVKHAPTMTYLYRPILFLIIALAISLTTWLNICLNNWDRTFNQASMNASLNEAIVMLAGVYALGMLGFLGRKWPARTCSGNGVMEISTAPEDRGWGRRIASILCMSVAGGVTFGLGYIFIGLKVDSVLGGLYWWWIANQLIVAAVLCGADLMGRGCLWVGPRRRKAAWFKVLAIYGILPYGISAVVTFLLRIKVMH
ncbi:hypothetical protein HDV00_004865 [Rhizophlyctis rosea]|nr:hypothetical protein HDV00_004865 [Rhizophlyctis rosea]